MAKLKKQKHESGPKKGSEKLVVVLDHAEAAGIMSRAIKHPLTTHPIAVDNRKIGGMSSRVSVFDTSMDNALNSELNIVRLSPEASSQYALTKRIIANNLPLTISGKSIMLMYNRMDGDSLSAVAKLDDLTYIRYIYVVIDRWIASRNRLTPLTKATEREGKGQLTTRDDASGFDMGGAGMTGAFNVLMSAYAMAWEKTSAFADGSLTSKLNVDTSAIVSSVCEVIKFILSSNESGKIGNVVLSDADENLNTIRASLKRDIDNMVAQISKAEDHVSENDIINLGQQLAAFIYDLSMLKFGSDFKFGIDGIESYRSFHSALSEKRDGVNIHFEIVAHLFFIMMKEYRYLAVSPKGSKSVKFLAFLSSFRDMKQMVSLLSTVNSDETLREGETIGFDGSNLIEFGSALHTSLLKRNSISSVIDIFDILITISEARQGYAKFIADLKNNDSVSHKAADELVRQMKTMCVALTLAPTEEAAKSIVMGAAQSSTFINSLTGALFHAASVGESHSTSSIAEILSSLEASSLAKAWNASDMAAYVGMTTSSHPLSKATDLRTGVCYNLIIKKPAVVELSNYGVVKRIGDKDVSDIITGVDDTKFNFYYRILTNQALSSETIITGIRRAKYSSGIDSTFYLSQAVKNTAMADFRKILSALAVQIAVHHQAKRYALLDFLCHQFDVSNAVVKAIQHVAFESEVIPGRDKILANAKEVSEAYKKLCTALFGEEITTEVLSSAENNTNSSDISVAYTSDNGVKTEGSMFTNRTLAFMIFDLYSKKVVVNNALETCRMIEKLYGSEGSASTSFQDIRRMSDTTIGMCKIALQDLQESGTAAVLEPMQFTDVNTFIRAGSLADKWTQKSFYDGLFSRKSFYMSLPQLVDYLSTSTVKTNDEMLGLGHTNLTSNSKFLGIHTMPKEILALVRSEFVSRSKNWYVSRSNDYSRMRSFLRHYSDVYYRLMRFASSRTEGVSFGIMPEEHRIPYQSNTSFLKTLLSIVGLSTEHKVSKEHAEFILTLVNAMSSGDCFPFVVKAGAREALNDLRVGDSLSVGDLLALHPRYRSSQKKDGYEALLPQLIYIRTSGAMDLIESDMVCISAEKGHNIEYTGKGNGSSLNYDYEQAIIGYQNEVPHGLIDIATHAPIVTTGEIHGAVTHIVDFILGAKESKEEVVAEPIEIEIDSETEKED